jgi:butyrate kinase
MDCKPESQAYKILVVNPGSTSTKVALFQGEEEMFSVGLKHDPKELAPFGAIANQYSYRKNLVLKVLEERGFNATCLSAVVGRGGILPPVQAGAYLVNDAMLKKLVDNPIVEHASNLGAIIADAIARPLGIPAYIYDCVATDELEDIARLSGMPLIPRISTFHALNSRAVAREVALSLGSTYQNLNFIVAHLGGGISLSVHKQGQVVDISADDEGPFSPERAGKVPCNKLIDLCFSGIYSKSQVKGMLRGNGGLKAYLGTTDLQEVENRIEQGDFKALQCFEAMGYQIAKGIGELSTVVDGKVDVIILTGGMAYDTRLVEYIKQKTNFLAQVVVVPGEREMQALALGTLRVLLGEEQALTLD